MSFSMPIKRLNSFNNPVYKTITTNAWTNGCGDNFVEILDRC